MEVADSPKGNSSEMRGFKSLEFKGNAQCSYSARENQFLSRFYRGNCNIFLFQRKPLAMGGSVKKRALKKDEILTRLKRGSSRLKYNSDGKQEIVVGL